jgi:diguanylate cyclase (GGDEF)-like protein
MDGRERPASVSEDFDTRWMAAWDLRRLDAPAALEAAASLRDEAEHLGDDGALARVELLEGSCRWRVSQYAPAMRSLMHALDHLPESRERERAAALLDLGTVHNYFGQHDAAMEHVLAALRIRDLLDDDVGRADAYNNLGIVFWNRGELDEAEQAYRRSVDLRHLLGDLDGAAACRNNIGKVLTARGHYDEALREFAAARESWEAHDNRRGLGMLHNNLGLVQLERGDLDAAATSFHESLAIKEGTHDLHGACETRAHLARVHAAQGELDAALALLDRAVGDAETLGIGAELAMALEALAEVHEARGDHAAALAAYRRFHAVDRQLFDERSAERLRGLQVAYQLERAEQESSTDGLTGLANRRTLDRRLHEQLRLARAHDTELSVALLDLDGFKRINDRFGHGIGDDVLRAMATLLRDHTKTSDLPARYGGEEFVVVLPDTSLTAATQAAQQLCDRVRGYPWHRIHPDLEVTVSIGVACASDVPDTATLLSVADRHLYLAKHDGKDQVRA